MGKRSSDSPVATGVPGKSSRTGPCRDCRLVMWVQYSEKKCFIEKPGIRGGRHVAKRSYEHLAPPRTPTKFRDGTVWGL